MRPTIYTHHSAYDVQGPELDLVNKQHRSENYPKSAFGYYTFYQYFIEKTGVVIQCRPERDSKVAYKDAHKNSISVCFAGHHDRYGITEEQKLAWRKLCYQFKNTYGTLATDIKEHRNYQKTSCPGSKLKRDYFAYLYLEYQLSGLRKLLQQLLLKLRNLV